MKLRRIISTDLEQSGEGFSVRAAIDAVVAVNVNEPTSAEHSRAGGDKEEGHPIKEAEDE